MRFKSAYLWRKKKSLGALYIFFLFTTAFTISPGIGDAGWGSRSPFRYGLVREIPWIVVGPIRAEAHETPVQPSWEPKWLDPVPAANFHLQDQDSNEVTLSDFYGKVILINFIYTNCRSACPLLTGEMSQIHKHLASSMGSDIVFLSISLDPERDTPETLREYGRKWKVDFSNWKFLTGSSPDIKKVLDAYRVFHEKENHSGKEEIAHSNPIYLIDQWGRVRKKIGPALFQQRGEEYIRRLVEEGKVH